MRVGIDKYEHMGCAAGHAWLARGVHVIAAGIRIICVERRGAGSDMVGAGEVAHTIAFVDSAIAGFR